MIKYIAVILVLTAGLGFAVEIGGLVAVIITDKSDGVAHRAVELGAALALASVGLLLLGMILVGLVALNQ
jgi:hypothetical protein